MNSFHDCYRYVGKTLEAYVSQGQLDHAYHYAKDLATVSRCLEMVELSAAAAALEEAASAGNSRLAKMACRRLQPLLALQLRLAAQGIKPT